jgi:hypothetical protein
MTAARLALLVFVASTLGVPARRARAMEKQACLEAFEDGQQQRKDGRLVSAHARFVACSEASCPALVRSECASAASAVDAQIPTISLRIVRDGRDVLDAEVTIDGKPAALDGKVSRIDPGPHKVAARAVGGASASVTQSVLLAAGEKNRVVTLELPAAPAPTPSAPAATPVAPTQPASPPPAQPEASTRPIWPWLSLGAGVVATGVFGVVGYKARDEYQRLERDCAPRCDAARVDALDRRILIADVALGVGIVALGASVYGFATTPAPSSPQASVSLDRGSAFATVRFAF